MMELLESPADGGYNNRIHKFNLLVSVIFLTSKSLTWAPCVISTRIAR